MELNTLQRIFKIKGREIIDPNPALPLASAVKTLALNFPVLRHTQVFEEDGVLSDDGLSWVFEIIMPPVKTNG
jgi:hypothetical protein